MDYPCINSIIDSHNKSLKRGKATANVDILKHASFDSSIINLTKRRKVSESFAKSNNATSCNKVAINQLEIAMQANSRCDRNLFIYNEIIELKLPTVENVRDEKSEKSKEDLLYHDKINLVSMIHKSLNIAYDEITVIDLLESIAALDPEFILKLALYTGNTLKNMLLRDMLLAYAIENEDCRQFVDKYFNSIIFSPADLLSTIAQLWKRTRVNYIPRKVRHCFVKKLISFSDDQLRKFRRTQKYLSSSDRTTEFVTLKRIVKLLHIKGNRELVMKILGCRYPQTPQEFYSSKLDGQFDPSKASKRMKFDTTLTWEYYISEKGNKAENWSVLIENDAIPYMDILKNLRSICCSTIERKYLDMVIKKLTDPDEIRKCKIFPVDYVTPFIALNNAKCSESTVISNGRLYKKQINLKARYLEQCSNVDLSLVFEALNKACRIATELNVPLLPGRTLIIQEIGLINQPHIQYNYLFASMMTSRCEQCDLLLFTEQGYISKIEINDYGLDAIYAIDAVVKKFNQEVTVLSEKSQIIDKSTKLGSIIESSRNSESDNRKILVYGSEENRTKFKSSLGASYNGGSYNNVDSINDSIPSAVNVDDGVDGNITNDIDTCIGVEDNEDSIEYVNMEDGDDGNVIVVNHESINDSGEIQSNKSNHKSEISTDDNLCHSWVEFIVDYHKSDSNCKILSSKLIHVSNFFFNLMSEPETVRPVDNAIMLLHHRYLDEPLIDHLSAYKRMKNINMKRMILGKADYQCNFMEDDYNVKRSEKSCMNHLSSTSNANRLAIIEQIDVTHKLSKGTNTSKLYGNVISPHLLAVISKWKNVRIFVSSAFEDTYSERYVLDKFVFPALHQCARTLYIKLCVIELGSSINAHNAQRYLEVCLDEARRSDIFIAIIGRKSIKVSLPNDNLLTKPRFQLIKSHSCGEIPVTEMEISYGVLERANSMRDKSFFYIRDEVYTADGKPVIFDKSQNSSLAKSITSDLEQRFIQTSDDFPIHKYSCMDVGTNAQGLDQFAKLDLFAQTVFDHVWTAINAMAVEKHTPFKWNETMYEPLKVKFEERITSINKKFCIGRYDEVAKDLALSLQNQQPGQRVIISGTSGSGKTFLLCRLIEHCSSGNKLQQFVVVSVFTDILQSYLYQQLYPMQYQSFILSYIYNEMNVNIFKTSMDNKSVEKRRNQFPQSAVEIMDKISSLVDKANKMNVTFLIFIDSIDSAMDDNITNALYGLVRSCSNIVVVDATLDGSFLSKYGDESLKKVELVELDSYSRRQLVTMNLASKFESTDNSALRLLINKQDAFLPLFLKIACNQLSLLQCNNLISLLSQSIVQIPQQLMLLVKTFINQISFKYMMNNGLNIVNMAISFLLAQNEYTDDELLSMLHLNEILPKEGLNEGTNNFNELMNNNLEENLFISAEFRLIFRSILFDLTCILRYSCSNFTISIAHSCIASCLRSCVDNELMKRVNFIRALHAWLIYYNKNYNCSWSVYSLEMVQLPGLLITANRQSELHDLLTSSDYLSDMCSLGLIDKLLSDYEAAIHIRSSLLDRMGSVLRNNQHLFRKYPTKFDEILKSKERTELLNEGVVGKFTILNHKFPIETMQIHDDDIVALGCSDGVIRLISLKKRNSCIGDLINGHSASVKCLSFIGIDGGMLASGCLNSKLCLWDYKNNAVPLKTFNHHQQELTNIVAYNELVATSGLDGLICTYNYSKSPSLVNKWFVENKLPISCMIRDNSHEDRLILAVLTWSNIVYLFDTNNGECRQKYTLLEWTTHLCGITTSTTSSQRLMTITGNQTLALVHVPHKGHALQLSPLLSGISCCHYNVGNGTVCTGYRNGSVALFKFEEPTSDYQTFQVINGSVNKIVANTFGIILSQNNGLLHIFANYKPDNIIYEKCDIGNYERKKIKSVGVVDMSMDENMVCVVYRPGNAAVIIDLEHTKNYFILHPKTISIGEIQSVYFRKIRNSKVVVILFKTVCSIHIRIYRLKPHDPYSFASLLKGRDFNFVESPVNITAFTAASHFTIRGDMYFAASSSDGNICLYRWNLIDYNHTLMLSEQLEESIDAISIVDELYDDKPNLLSFITIHSSLNNANISWWSVKDNTLLHIKCVKLSNDPPMALFGRLLILKSGICRKYGKSNPDIIIWECSIDTTDVAVDGFAYNPGQLDSISGIEINETLYTIAKGKCIAYSLPPMRTILPRSLLHSDVVTSVYVSNNRLLSCSRDGSLISYELCGDNINESLDKTSGKMNPESSQFIREAPISINISNFDDKTVCVILFSHGHVSVWRKLRKLKWEFDFKVITPVYDAVFAFYDCENELDMVTSQGLRYRFTSDFKKFKPIGKIAALLTPKLIMEKSKGGMFIVTAVTLKSKPKWKIRIFNLENDHILTKENYCSKMMLSRDGNFMFTLCPGQQFIEFAELSSCSPYIQYPNRHKRLLSEEEMLDSSRLIQLGENTDPSNFTKCIRMLNEQCICLIDSDISCASNESRFGIILGALNGYIYKMNLSIKDQVLTSTTRSEYSHSESITCILFSSGSKFIWSGSSDCTIQLWRCCNLKKLTNRKWFTPSVPFAIYQVPDNENEVIVTCRNGEVICLNYRRN
ncbi:hypothetical protein GJ496_001974 [Pomphorhynchus laevis]|nr:hypothetical protein GJ496_001974 [Pomphorhynchus laevis]